MHASLAYVALCWVGSAAPAHVRGLMGGGGPPSPVSCLSDAERERARDLAAAYATRGSASALASPEKFTFYPLAGTLYRDLFVYNFVDLDPTGSILDWDCTDFSYNGHDATDTMIRTFGEQAIGVPVFAALNGTVIAAHDGEDDMNTSCVGNANFVGIDHGAGRVCYYFHLRKESVLVALGQSVKAGEQLGLAASSGCSTYPHLHFSTYDQGVLLEPFAGDCRPGPSAWTDQTPIERALYAADFNVTNADIGTYPGLPFDMPRSGTFAQGVRDVRFWLNLINQPAGSTWRVRVVRPNGTAALDSGTVAFGNTSLYRWAWWWWWYTLDLNQLGKWRIVLFIDGAVTCDAPFDVVATPAQIVNRAPYPVTAHIHPAAPLESDVLICGVQTDLVLDDPDYDIVRYRYQWKVDGNVVRDVVNAAHSDVFPRETAPTGALVSCSVTPMDAVASGPTTVDTVRVNHYPAVSSRKP